jgi:hypothetical protein
MNNSAASDIVNLMTHYECAVDVYLLTKELYYPALPDTHPVYPCTNDNSGEFLHKDLLITIINGMEVEQLSTLKSKLNPLVDSLVKDGWQPLT